MNYLLDTHVLFWWLEGDKRLGRDRQRLLERCERQGEHVGVAAITAWELALLGSARRLAFDCKKLFARVEELRWIDWLPLTPEVAIEAMRLGAAFHRDPADQLIAATARVHGLKLLTADENIRNSGAVEVI